MLQVQAHFYGGTGRKRTTGAGVACADAEYRTAAAATAGGDRGIGSPVESKPIKKDSSWPPSFRPEDFQLSEVPDKIDQRMVDQIDLDSDAPLSLFNKDLPNASPAPPAHADLFHPLPSSPAVPTKTPFPKIPFGESPKEQVSAPKGTKTAFDADPLRPVFDTSAAAPRSLPGADPFAPMDFDVQVGFEAPPVPPRPAEPPPLPAKPNGSSIPAHAAQHASTLKEMNAAPQPAFQKGDGEVFVGNDPFADLEGYPPAPVEAGSELELDIDGPMTVSKPETTPAPSHLVNRVSLPKEQWPAVAPSAPLPSIDQALTAPEQSRELLWWYRIGFSVLALVGLLLVVIVYRSGGKPDLTSWSTYVGAFSSSAKPGQANADLQVKKVASSTYRNLNGHELLLVWGEVHNASKESVARVLVNGRLLSAKGQLLGEYAVPAGVVFTPGEIYQMEDATMVAAEYQKKVQEMAGKELPPGGSLPFMIVTYDPPDTTGEITARVVPSIVKD